MIYKFNLDGSVNFWNKIIQNANCDKKNGQYFGMPQYFLIKVFV